MKDNHSLLSVLSAGVVITLILVLFVSVSNAETLVVDQQQSSIDLSVGGVAIGGSSKQKLAQTFTVGIQGKLTQVDLPIVCESGGLVIEIQSVGSDGKPDGTVWLRKVYSGKKLPTLNSTQMKTFRFNKSLNLPQGAIFAIVMRNEQGNCAIYQGSLGDPYPSGEFFFDDLVNSAGWIPNSQFNDRDLPFQTWMVIP